jgi:hypothetical protein
LGSGTRIVFSDRDKVDTLLFGFGFRIMRQPGASSGQLALDSPEGLYPCSGGLLTDRWEPKHGLVALNLRRRRRCLSRSAKASSSKTSDFAIPAATSGRRGT